MEPTPERERVGELDALRGLALLGILAANMRGFGAPAAVYHHADRLWPALPDRVAQAFIDCFVTGKFLTLFSVLFGLGFAVQFGRAGARGENFSRLYLRRLAALLLFGAAHAFLVWWGDVLLIYAAAGFFLLLFAEQHQRTVLLWAVLLYWFPVFVMLGLMVLSSAHPVVCALPSPCLQETIRAYAQGGFAEIVSERSREWWCFNARMPFFPLRVFALFLCGLAIWRSGLFRDLPRYIPLLVRLSKWGLAVGLPANVVAVLIDDVWRPDPAVAGTWTLISQLSSSIGVPALSLFYACVAIVLYQRMPWRRWLEPFGAVGRMSLTNYLLQSVAASMLFYSYGLGLFGKVGPLAGLAPTILIYAAQLMISRWWLRRFRFGPLEWLWRTLTYGARPAIRMPVPGG